ncbi:MAG: hypothetical protein AAB354_08240 [candidate division KSB1 bacterium]
MSAEMVSNTKTIYVELLDEGTTVMRPTQGEALGGDVYRLLPSVDYDPEDEHWEFTPGSIVRCLTEVKGNEEILVAREGVKEPVRSSQGFNDALFRSVPPANLGARIS